MSHNEYKTLSCKYMLKPNTPAYFAEEEERFILALSDTNHRSQTYKEISA
jgi:hypothetical protein